MVIRMEMAPFDSRGGQKLSLSLIVFQTVIKGHTSRFILFSLFLFLFSSSLFLLCSSLSSPLLLPLFSYGNDYHYWRLWLYFGPSIPILLSSSSLFLLFSSSLFLLLPRKTDKTRQSWDWVSQSLFPSPSFFFYFSLYDKTQFPSYIFILNTDYTLLLLIFVSKRTHFCFFISFLQTITPPTLQYLANSEASGQRKRWPSLFLEQSFRTCSPITSTWTTWTTWRDQTMRCRILYFLPSSFHFILIALRNEECGEQRGERKRERRRERKERGKGKEIKDVARNKEGSKWCERGSSLRKAFTPFYLYCLTLCVCQEWNGEKGGQKVDSSEVSKVGKVKKEEKKKER